MIRIFGCILGVGGFWIPAGGGRTVAIGDSVRRHCFRKCWHWFRRHFYGLNSESGRYVRRWKFAHFKAYFPNQHFLKQCRYRLGWRLANRYLARPDSYRSRPSISRYCHWRSRLDRYGGSPAIPACRARGGKYVAGSADFGRGHNRDNGRGVNANGDNHGWFYAFQLHSDRYPGGQTDRFRGRVRESRTWSGVCTKRVRRR